MKTSNSKKDYSLVVGMGATGLSIAQFLQKRGENFHLFDTRSESMVSKQFSEMFPLAEKFYECVDSSVLEHAHEVYLSPGVPRDEYVVTEALRYGKSVVGDIELFLREVNTPVIGITGSNGKSTVTTLVGLAAEAAGIKVAVGGNIGKPALELLDEDVELFVLELSSFQLESTNNPQLHVACNLNISADHMDRYDDLSKYVMAKQRIFEGAKNVVYNLDDPLTRPPIMSNENRFGFGLNQGIGNEEAQFIFCPESGRLIHDTEQLALKDEIRLKGIHNVKNALALFAIAEAAGISLGACKEVLRTFGGLPHRCEVVSEQNGVTFINDSKATNVGATQAAIKGLSPEFSGIVLIAGGDGKGADFQPLAKSIDENVRVLVLLGKDGHLIEEELTSELSPRYAASMHEAVEVAKSEARTGEVVLLSPACASLDMFNNFEERGQKFVESVMKLEVA